MNAPLDDLPLSVEDRLLIERSTVGRSDRHGLVAEYRRRWQAAAQGETSEVRREFAGRRAANAWLREATA